MTISKTAVRIGRDVIRTEILGLEALESSLGAAFEQAVARILDSSGHLILFGLGKSGHIARKLASSFASTGTPSFFLHPTEAAHGDLGMISAESVVLGISNSGESQEVNGVMNYAKSLGIPTLAITGGASSTLGQLADIALILPRAEEACPNQLAPTTSTTQTLALGDALCVAVMSARGFTAEDFGARHPAGKLGLGLQKLGDYVARQKEPPPLIAASAPMQDVILSMTSGGKGCVGVVDDDTLIGIITDGDLRRAMSENIMTQTAREIMTRDPFVLSPDMRMKEALAAFTQRKIGNAFVVEDGAILGLLDLKTLLATGYV